MFLQRRKSDFQLSQRDISVRTKGFILIKMLENVCSLCALGVKTEKAACSFYHNLTDRG